MCAEINLLQLLTGISLCEVQLPSWSKKLLLFAGHSLCPAFYWLRWKRSEITCSIRITGKESEASRMLVPKVLTQKNDGQKSAYVGSNHRQRVGLQAFTKYGVSELPDFNYNTQLVK